MKAEERHELRENDLASWLQYGLWGFLRQNGSYILLVGALAFLGYTLWQRHKQTVADARTTAFVDFNTALSSGKSLEQLPDMVETSAYPEIKVQAALELARLYGTIAIDPGSLDQQKLTRAGTLSKAYDYYTKALEIQGSDPLVAGKAHLGIAGIREDQGEWDKASEEYDLVIKDSKFDGPIKQLAQDYKDKLDQRRNAPRLAAWMPPPPAVPTPTPGAPSIGPLNNSVLPLPGSQNHTDPFMIGPMLNSPSKPTPGALQLPGGMGISPVTPAMPSSTQPISIFPESTTKPK